MIRVQLLNITSCSMHELRPGFHAGEPLTDFWSITFTRVLWHGSPVGPEKLESPDAKIFGTIATIKLRIQIDKPAHTSYCHEWVIRGW